MVDSEENDKFYLGVKGLTWFLPLMILLQFECFEIFFSIKNIIL